MREAQVCINELRGSHFIIPLTLQATLPGSLNIASRDLPCLPSALFEIHLSITPEKLPSVPDEPHLPEKVGKNFRSNPTTWYDQQDLTFLRARNNQIVELQPEISLFGSLKTIDVSLSVLFPTTQPEFLFPASKQSSRVTS